MTGRVSEWIHCDRGTRVSEKIYDNYDTMCFRVALVLLPTTHLVMKAQLNLPHISNTTSI